MTQANNGSMPETLTPNELQKQAIAEEIHDLLIEAWQSDSGPHTLTRDDIADTLDIPPSRVSQVVRELLIPDGKAAQTSPHRAEYRVMDTSTDDRYQWRHEQ